jgi:cob(I)alamin adenosyltransferase
MSIYTRTGDAGETGLTNGERVSKSSPLISFAGHLDELNAYIGLCVSHLKSISQDNTSLNFSDEVNNLGYLQNNLFVIGSISDFTKLVEVQKEFKILEN